MFSSLFCSFTLEFKATSDIHQQHGAEPTVLLPLGKQVFLAAHKEIYVILNDATDPHLRSNLRLSEWSSVLHGIATGTMAAALFPNISILFSLLGNQMLSFSVSYTAYVAANLWCVLLSLSKLHTLIKETGFLCTFSCRKLEPFSTTKEVFSVKN